MERDVIAVDFDSTIAKSPVWLGDATPADALDGAVEFLRALGKVFDIVIFSARGGTLEGKQAIRQWARDNGVSDLIAGVTNVKDYRFWRFVDDRAVAFKGDYGAVLAELGVPSFAFSELVVART